MREERGRPWTALVSGVGLVVGLALAVPVAAQTIRGTITGTVTDSTGAAVPGVTVTVTHTATGIGSSAVSGGDGFYTIPLLSPGTYQATVEQSGFKKYLRNGIAVQIAQTTRLDIPLQVGNMAEAVEVVAEVPLVRSTTAELGQVIEMKQIQALPLNGRFFQHLITMTPGAMPFYGRGDSAENASSAVAKIPTAHTLNRMPWSGHNYLLDGLGNNEVRDVVYDPVTHVPFAGNIIPTNRINPISRVIANDIYPEPNLPGLANNRIDNLVLTQTVNAGDARVDYKMSDRSSLFARFSM